MNLPDDENPNLLTIIGLLIALALTTFAAESPDPDFNSSLPTGSTIHSLEISSNGGAIVGGTFSDGQNLAHLKASGQLDSTLTLTVTGPVLATATDPSGRILIGGGFSSVNGDSAENLARLLPNGDLDPAFTLETPNGRVHVIKLLADGRILIAGDFTRIGSISANYLACLHSDGSVDGSFQSPLQLSYAMEAGAFALVVQADGKILVGGTFELPGAPVVFLRLNPDGSVDNTFAQQHGSILYLEQISVAADGSIFICGMANSNGEGFVRKLSANGVTTSDFSAAVADGPIKSLSVGTDGSVFLGGDFSNVNGQPRGNLAKLLPGGALDHTFAISTDGPVEALAATSNGTYVAGSFSIIGDQSASSIARLIVPNYHSTGTVNRTSFKSFIPGEAGKTYAIETSADLKAWSTFGITTATEAGIEVNDSALKENARRFFRARLVD